MNMGAPRIKILLSFDHELSLGRTTSFLRNLFAPTDRLIELAGELCVPINIFTDVLCAIRFKEWDEDGFYKLYSEQIIRTIRAGHDVQLHLHPHWMDSEFHDGRFFPASSFTFSVFYNRDWPKNIEGIVTTGIKFLTALCRKADPFYKCIAYRAGGYNLAPRTEDILAALYKNGIRLDSSIPRGFTFESDLSKIDYRKIKSKKPNWFIPLTGPADGEADAGLFEIPIATRPRNIINNLPYVIKRLWIKTGLTRKGNFHPAGVAIHVGRSSIWKKGRSFLLPASAWMLEFDDQTGSVRSLMKIFDRYIKKYRQNDLGQVILSTISHPKAMGEYSFDLMCGFIERIRSDYGHHAEFCTYSQIYRELSSQGMIEKA